MTNQDFTADESEKFLRLKYFYLIDISALKKEIHDHEITKNFIEYQDINKVPLFQHIFSEIIEKSVSYTSFILSNGDLRNSAFSEDYKDFQSSREINFLVRLCTISLFHHCIIRGFKKTLDSELSSSEKATTRTSEIINIDSKYNNDFKEFIKLSGATEHDIKQGYYCSTRNTDAIIKLNNDNTIYQSYYSLFTQFNRKDDTHYSYHVLNKLFSREQKNSNEHFVLKSESNPALFLLREPVVNTLNKALIASNDKRIIRYYHSLKEYSNDWRTGILSASKDEINSKLDAILFDITIESVYGFKLIEYVETLLKEIHIQTSTSKNSLKLLEGQVLLEIIQKYIFTLPITYNRSIFLRYAMDAIRYSENLAASFPPAPSGSHLIPPVTYTSKTPLSSDMFAIKTTKLTSDFFRMIGYIVLPLIEDLWDCLTSENTLDINIDNACYQCFIQKNYELIVYDYSLLPRNFLDNISNLKFENLYDTFASSLRDFIGKAHPGNDITSHNTTNTVVNNYLASLIKSQCNSSTKTEKTEWIMNLMKPDYKLTSYTGDYDKYDREIEVFKKTHVMSLFNFIQTLVDY